MIVCVQTFGALAHWHPHLHVLVTDGAFTRDSRFRPAPAHDAALLQEAFRRAVLAWFVREGWLEAEAALAMLAWPHPGFGAHLGPAIAGDDRESLTRVARYGARAPVAEDRLWARAVQGPGSSTSSFIFRRRARQRGSPWSTWRRTDA